MSGSNLYFNNYENSGEQDLIESLIVESMGIYGHTIFYCPRTLVAKDDIYGEDTISEYNNHYNFDVYIKSFDRFEGDGAFLSKFNLEVRDQTIFTIARRAFLNEITNYDADITRPREGDLIYSSMLKKLMIIMSVNPTAIFYQMGALQTWDCTCEVFEYSSERLNTGVDEIDDIGENFSLDEEGMGILTSAGLNLVDDSGFSLILGQVDIDGQSDDVFADNDEILAEGGAIVDWSDRDPFSSSLE